MSLLATASFATLIDIARRTDPDGKFPEIVELLNLSEPILEDIPWEEGNLPTGERTTVRTGLPLITNNNFRRLNEGVPLVKSTTAQIDEGAAMLEAFAEVDRTLACMSPSGPGAFRMDEAAATLESMSQFMATNVIYGNAAADARTFTGLAPRYAAKTGTTGKNIVDAGGTGTNNASVWMVMWGRRTVRGIYPKGTKGGFTHTDVTTNKALGPDGYPIGDVLKDANGNRYMGYRDHYAWNCGLTLKDWRYVVRIANIDRNALISGTGAADIARAMIAAYDKIPNFGLGLSIKGVPSRNDFKSMIYMDRTCMTALDLQVYDKAVKTLFDWKEYDTGSIMTFRGIPIRPLDALSVAEARVV